MFRFHMPHLTSHLEGKKANEGRPTVVDLTQDFSFYLLSSYCFLFF